MNRIYQSLSISIILIIGLVCAGCLSGKIDVTDPNGRHVAANIDALAHDADIEGFEWIGTESNTVVRVTRYVTTGGNSNLTAVCAASQAWAEAIKAAAEAAK